MFSSPVCGLRGPWWGALNRLPQVLGARLGEGGGEVAWMGAGPQEASCFHRDKKLSGCILGRNLSHTSWFCSPWGKRKWQTNLRPEKLIDSFWWGRMCVCPWWTLKSITWQRDSSELVWAVFINSPWSGLIYGFIYSECCFITDDDYKSVHIISSLTSSFAFTAQLTVFQALTS